MVGLDCMLREVVGGGGVQLCGEVGGRLVGGEVC